MYIVTFLYTEHRHCEMIAIHIHRLKHLLIVYVLKASKIYSVCRFQVYGASLLITLH